MAQHKKDRKPRALIHRDIIKELLEEQLSWEDDAFERPQHLRFMSPRQRQSFSPRTAH